MSQTFMPITNIYTDVIISNSTAVLQRAQRITSQPDLLFTAADLGFFAPPDDDVFVLYDRGFNFVDNDAINGQTVQAGPGILAPQGRITFTTLLPAFLNSSSFLDGPGAPIEVWGSFDESTNLILYPNSLSIQQL